MAENAPGKRRVAIVGGGCAGLAAAWQLSRQHGYEIHVYEKSWRLGGKGASVRDADGRILEHGLHVWLGFYENAFRMMRECYAEVERREWGPGPEAAEKLVHGRIADAFIPEPNVGVVDPDLRGEWAAWSGFFPPAAGLPGEPLDARTNPFTLPNYLLRCLSLLKTLMLSMIGPASEGNPGDPRPNRRSGFDEALYHDFIVEGAGSVRLLIERMGGLLRSGSLTSAAVMLQAVTMLEVWLHKLDFAPQVSDSAIQLAEALAVQTRKLLRDVCAVDPKLRMKTEVIDIVMTIAVGLFRDRVMFDPRGLDAINHFDYRDWLHKHGLTNTALESRFLTGIYDFVFAYRNGDRSKPALAAGVALRGAFRMFLTYRGAMFWRMGSGMGDAVFAPLYRVLLAGRKLGDGKREPASPVTFHFMHELSAVEFGVSQKQQRYATRLTFRTPGDASRLDERSKAALDESGCWPDNAEQRFGAAIGAEQREITLDLGIDFDMVVFATSIDDFNQSVAANLPEATGKASAAQADWRRMGTEVRTVATKSAQVWLRKDIESLGWHRGSGLITALGCSFSTWADMTHTLAAERAWRGARSNALDDARSVAYFCDVLPDSEIDKLREQAESNEIASIRDVLRAHAETLGSAHHASHAGEHDPRRVALDAISNIAIAGELRSAVHAVLSRLLQEIAAKGHALTHLELADRLSAVEKTLEADVFEAALKAKMEHDLNKLLAREMRPIWPAAFAGGYDAMGFELARHVQANRRASDRYTLSLPVSTAFRISPLDRTVENMTIAGDWTSCGLDASCVEAAVMSGMLAAYAISGQPEPRSIIGYDHP